MKFSNLIIILLINIVLISGCGKSSSDKIYSLEIKNASGKIIAKGSISLPDDIEKAIPFTGSYKINVLNVSDNPSSEYEFAIRTLSEKNGDYAGTIKNGTIYLTLQPRVDDSDIFFEGKYSEQIIEGNCTYQSYAEELEFGKFVAKSVIK